MGTEGELTRFEMPTLSGAGSFHLVSSCLRGSEERRGRRQLGQDLAPVDCCHLPRLRLILGLRMPLACAQG